MTEPIQETRETLPEEQKKRGLFPARFRKKGGGRKAWALLAVLIAVAGVSAVTLHRAKADSQKGAETTYVTAETTRQSITRTLTSSGTLEPADSYTVTTLVSGEILSDTFEEGDLVEKDQLLYTLDASDAETSVTQAQNSYTQAQNSYTQAQKSYQQAVKSKYPTADLSGTVKEVYVRNGDSVNAGTQLLKIVGDDKIYMDFIFSYVDSSNFYIGQSATVFIDNLEGSLQGTVTAVSQAGSADETGRVNTTVRVQATNPGLVSTSATASAVIGSYTSYGSSNVHISSSSIITASASGKIADLNLLAGDTVAKGDRICTITGDSVDNSIDNAEISVDNARTGIQNAQTSVDNARERLEDYSVTAPISGTVVTKTAKAGDKIEGGSTGTLCTIYDLSYLEMTMSIDELDISDVAVGQTVEITADAVEDRTYTGVVTKVSVAGSTSGGITTYPVTVRIDETDGLRPGMNVDAEIVIDSVENTLTIPSAAVNRGNTVLITADSPSAGNALDQEAPEGYVYVQVETGISDDSSIAITSGLQEGDTVAYIPTASSSGVSMMMEGGMMMGGPGGGMAVTASGGGPGGGGPGGGGPGGGF